MERLNMRKIPVTGANCLERCCGTDVGFGLQKDKIIKVEYKLWTCELMLITNRVSAWSMLLKGLEIGGIVNQGASSSFPV